MKLKSNKTDLMSVRDISCSPGGIMSRGESLHGQIINKQSEYLLNKRLAVDGL
jgi:hypothetical protein